MIEKLSNSELSEFLDVMDKSAETLEHLQVSHVLQALFKTLGSPLETEEATSDEDIDDAYEKMNAALETIPFRTEKPQDAASIDNGIRQWIVKARAMGSNGSGTSFRELMTLLDSAIT